MIDVYLTWSAVLFACFVLPNIGRRKAVLLAVAICIPCHAADPDPYPVDDDWAYYDDPESSPAVQAVENGEAGVASASAAVTESIETEDQMLITLTGLLTDMNTLGTTPTLTEAVDGALDEFVNFGTATGIAQRHLQTAKALIAAARIFLEDGDEELAKMAADTAATKAYQAEMALYPSKPFDDWAMIAEAELYWLRITAYQP